VDKALCKSRGASASAWERVHLQDLLDCMSVLGWISPADVLVINTGAEHHMRTEENRQQQVCRKQSAQTRASARELSELTELSICLHI
jgi:hypothetical protein